MFVVEQELGQRASQFGFADTGRSEENKRTDRTIGILETGARAHHRIGHSLNGFILANHALVQIILELEQFFFLAFEQFRYRYAGPAATTAAISSSSTSSLISCALPGSLLQILFIGQFALQIRQLAVLKLGGAIEIVLPLGLLDFDLGLLDLFSEAAQTPTACFSISQRARSS